jgi:hypothetical protein
MVEPIHVPILGLLIAAIGAGWQVYRDHGRASSVAITKNQPETKSKQRISLAESEITSQKRILSTEGLKRRQQILYQLTDYLNGPVAGAHSLGMTAWNSVRPKVATR